MQVGQRDAESVNPVTCSSRCRQSTSMRHAAYMMVVRCGKPGGGKGALVSDDIAMTLSTSVSTMALFHAIGGDSD